MRVAEFMRNSSAIGKNTSIQDAEKYDAAKAPQVDAGRELIDLAKICESDSILDIGCGTGKLTVELVREDFSKKNILTAELNKRIAGSIRYSIKGGIH